MEGETNTISRKSSNNKEGSNKSRATVIGWSFGGTLVVWGASVGLEMCLNKTPQLLLVPAGFIFFQSANTILRRRVSRGDPLLVNTAVSLIHSSLTSFAVVFIILNQWLLNPQSSLGNMLEHEELVHRTWAWAYQALCFSCGYFAYDQFDMLNHKLYSPAGFPSVLAHHLVLLLCFTLALFRNLTINYLILTLFCELHSVFLHARKIRRMVGIRNLETALVKAEWALNWLTFVATRLIPHALILIKLVKDASKFNNGIVLPLACFGMIAMNALNIGLGIDLLGAFKREIQPKSARAD